MQKAPGFLGGAKLREAMAVGYWSEIAGPQAAAASQAVQIVAGVLTVRTANGVWSQELGLHKRELIRKLNARLGAPLVKDIRFHAEGVQPQKETSTEVTAQELEAVVLPEEDRQQLNAELSRLSDIPDEKLRRLLQRNMEKSARWRRYRLNLGWKPCTRCGIVHSQPHPECPLCRLSATRVDAGHSADL